MSSATSEEAMSISADEEFQFLINEKTTDLKTVMTKKKKGREYKLSFIGYMLHAT